MELGLKNDLLKINGIFEIDVIGSISGIGEYFFNIITTYPNCHLLQEVANVFIGRNWVIGEIKNDLYRIHVYASQQ